MARLLACLGLAALAAAGLGYGAGEMVQAGVTEAAQEPASKSLHPVPAVPDPRPADGNFVGLGQFVVPVVKESRVVMFLLAEVTVELAARDDRTTLETMRPKVRSVVLEFLYDVAATGQLAGERIDVPGITERLSREVQASLGPVKLQQLMFDRLMLQNNGRA